MPLGGASTATPSLSHDPNDDIAAAIAAVAAGESHLKMPSAAVEVEQVTDWCLEREGDVAIRDADSW